MDSANWPASYMNIAEVFIDSTWDSSNINLKDLSTNLGIWSRCNEVPDDIIKKARPLRESRNQIAHSNGIQSETAKDRIFNEINAVISEPTISIKIANLQALFIVLKDLKDNKIHSDDNEISNIHMVLKVQLMLCIIVPVVAVLAVRFNTFETWSPSILEQLFKYQLTDNANYSGKLTYYVIFVNVKLFRLVSQWDKFILKLDLCP